MLRQLANPRPLLVLGIAASLVISASCSGDDGGEEETGAEDTFPVGAVTGVDESCTDPEGDLLTASGAVVAEPRGIDLLSGEVVLEDEVMRIAWTTAGDPAEDPTAWFSVLQGAPGDSLSWELRVDTDDQGRWRTSLLTNERVTGDPRLMREQRTTPLPVVPTVDRTGVRLDVHQGMLPHPGSVAWMFGSAVGGRDGVEAVFDDCSNLYAPSAPDTTPAGDGAEGTAPVAPDGDEGGGADGGASEPAGADGTAPESESTEPAATEP